MSAADSRASMLQKGIAASKRSSLVLVALSILEGGVSLLAGSIALFADTVHTVSDIAGSVLVWAGLRISLKRPTERFPYGFYKAESISALIVSIIILFTGIGILQDSMEKLFSPSVISFRILVIVVAIGSGLVSFSLARYKDRVGRETNSQALIVESRHSMTDVLNAVLVCSGVAFTYFNILWAEALAGFIIGLFILWSAFRFGKDSVFSLMDISVEPEIRTRIRDLMEKTPGVVGIHALKIRKSGPFMFAEAHIEVDKGTTVEAAHMIADTVENRVKNSVKTLDSVTIHIGLTHKQE